MSKRKQKFDLNLIFVQTIFLTFDHYATSLVSLVFTSISKQNYQKLCPGICSQTSCSL